MPDTWTTLRGTSGPCRVTQESGDGTPIKIHCAVDADLLPSDTVYINNRTYTVIWSPPPHGYSAYMEGTLQETARGSPYPADWVTDADGSLVVDSDTEVVTDT
jgi:hypothetical protein